MHQERINRDFLRHPAKWLCCLNLRPFEGWRTSSVGSVLLSQWQSPPCVRTVRGESRTHHRIPINLVLRSYPCRQPIVAVEGCCLSCSRSFVSSPL